MRSRKRRGHKGQARRGRRHGSRPAYSGKWSDEDDVADQHHDPPPWQVRISLMHAMVG